MLIKIFLKILIYYNYLLNYIDLTCPLNFIQDCIYRYRIRTYLQQRDASNDRSVVSLTLGTRRSRNHDVGDISLGASNLRFWGSVMPRIFGRTCMFQCQRSKDGYPCALPRKPAQKQDAHRTYTYVRTYVVNAYARTMRV